MTEEKRPSWARRLTEAEYERATRGIFSVGAAAAYLATSQRWVRECIHDGRLEAAIIGKGYVIQKSRLDRLLGAE